MSDTEPADSDPAPGHSNEAPADAQPPRVSPQFFPLHGIKPPGKLETKVNIVENWKSYKQAWDNYSIITSLHLQPEPYQVALFLHCVGPDAVKIYNGLDFDSEDDRKSLKMIFKKFDLFTMGEVNETYERYVFNSRTQQPDESIDAYNATLRVMASTCNFCDCLKDTLLRDRIVLGIQSQQTRKRLLQERHLTLKNCIDLCRSAETACTHLKSMACENKPVEDVKAVSNPDKQKSKKPDPNVRSCKFCGGDHPATREKCPAWGKTCNACKGRNHFARVCKKSSSSVRAVQEKESKSDSEGDDVQYVTSVTLVPDNICSVKATKSPYAKEIYAEMVIDKEHIKFQIDRGTIINVLPLRYVRGHPITPTKKILRMWNGTELKPTGLTRLCVMNPRNKKRYSIEFAVVDEDLSPLLGARAAQHMNILTVHHDAFAPATPSKPHVPHGLDVSALTTVEQVINLYPEVPAGDSTRSGSPRGR